MCACESVHLLIFFHLDCLYFITIVSRSNYPKNLELTSFFVVVVVVVVFDRVALVCPLLLLLSLFHHSSFATTQTSATAVAAPAGGLHDGRYNVKVDRKVANPVLFIFCSFRFALCYLCSGLLLDFFALPPCPVISCVCERSRRRKTGSPLVDAACFVLRCFFLHFTLP